MFCSIGTVGTGVGLIWLAFVNCQRTLAIVALCLSTGVNSFVFGGYVVAYSDLSPNFTGTLCGMANTVSSMSGFLAPLATGAITEGNVRLLEC